MRAETFYLLYGSEGGTGMTPEFIDRMTPEERRWYHGELVDVNERIAKKLKRK